MRVTLEHDLAGPGRGTAGRLPLPDARQLSDTFTRTGIHADSIVVVYSPSADGVNVATRAWCVLRRAGLADVRVLDGGLDAWVAAGGERGEALTEAEGLGSAEP